MFQNIRQNSQVYILHKNGKPSLEIGMVKEVTTPMPKYPLSPQNLYGQQEMVVDIIVSVGGREIRYPKIPINTDIAEIVGENVVVATNRDAMNTEVASMKQRSVDSINSIPYHEDVVAGCDEILNVLNPELAERQRQQGEIGELKAQIAEQNKQIAEQNKQILEMKSLLMSSGTSNKK